MFKMNVMDPIVSPILDIGPIDAAANPLPPKGKAPVMKSVSQPEQQPAGGPEIVVTAERGPQRLSEIPAAPLTTVTPESLQPMAQQQMDPKGFRLPLPDVVMPSHDGINMRAPLGQGGIGHHRNLLDVLAGLVVGNTPETQLSPQAQREVQQNRHQASQMAVNAFNDPGEGFMGPPVVDGKTNLTDNLATLFRTITRL